MPPDPDPQPAWLRGLLRISTKPGFPTLTFCGNVTTAVEEIAGELRRALDERRYEEVWRLGGELHDVARIATEVCAVSAYPPAYAPTWPPIRR